MKAENITLFCYKPKKGIDKVYIIDLMQDDQGKWAVTGFYGRRGYPQKAFEVCRTHDFNDAKMQYDDRIRAKCKKGYTASPPEDEPLGLGK